MRLPRLLPALFIAFGLSATATQADPNFWKHEWPNTDFTQTTIENWVEIMSGGPPKDGPALAYCSPTETSSSTVSASTPASSGRQAS